VDETGLIANEHRTQGHLRHRLPCVVFESAPDDQRLFFRIFSDFQANKPSCARYRDPRSQCSCRAQGDPQSEQPHAQAPLRKKKRNE
jgi:hypothetical protein